MKPGDRKKQRRKRKIRTSGGVTIYAIARRARVSATTVSSVLNGKHPNRYSRATAERVRAIADEIGFRWNATARSLKTRRFDRLQVITPNWREMLLNESQMQLYQGIADEAQQQGLEVMLTLLEYGTWHSADGLIRTLERNDVDGHLIVPATYDAELPDDSRPIVVCGEHPARGGARVVSVDCENREGAEAATRHLVDRGHRRIVHLEGHKDAFCAIERRQGYETVMREAGLEPRVEACGFTDHDGYDAGRRIRKDARAIDAVFASSDLAALGAIRAFMEEGWNVPGDVAVVGFDGIHAGRLLHPTLTTIVQPMIELGREAVRRLCAWLAGGKPETSRTLLPVELRRGESA